jgi:hypothetical protein
MDTSSPYGAGAIPPPMYEPRQPSPPRLHWGWVLGLDLLTRNLFGGVWLVVQANWVRKVRGKSTAFVLAIVNCCIFPTLILIGFVGGMMGATEDSSWLNIVIVIGGLGFLVLWFASVFTLRSELSEGPIDIPLSGAMTFFFGRSISSTTCTIMSWETEVDPPRIEFWDWGCRSRILRLLLR